MSQYSIKDFVNKSKDQEKEFIELLKPYLKIKSAVKSEDIYEHWDLEASIKIDLKAIKKIRRSDSQTNENIHWVELIGNTGQYGWLYGEAQYFAFELEDYWMIVKAESLRDLIKHKCRHKIYSQIPKLYHLYTREGRKDTITLVKTIDLMQLDGGLVISKS